MKGAATPKLYNRQWWLYMIEKTEYGVLISYEEWEEIQEKLKSTTSQKDKTLEKENQTLREVLSQVELFLNTGDSSA